MEAPWTPNHPVIDLQCISAGFCDRTLTSELTLERCKLKLDARNKLCLFSYHKVLLTLTHYAFTVLF